MDTEGIRDTARAIAHSHAEMHLIEYLKRLRNQNAEQFVKAILNTNRTTAKELFRRFALTPQEMAFVVDEIMLRNNWSFLEATRKLGIGKAEPAEPIGEEFLLAAIKQLRRENPSWTLYRVKQFVESRIKRQFAKPSKPFTKQDVAVGAEWYSNARKILKAEKDKSDKQVRSNAYVPIDRWQEFSKTRFGTSSPSFLRGFQKAVRDHYRKNQKIRIAKNETN